MLATLDISAAKDDQGKVVSFVPTFIAGVVRYVISSCCFVRWVLTLRFWCFRCPANFPCRIEARSHVREDVVDGWRTADF
jgi:hypothetical protein